jgi:uncharacterized protein
MDSAAVYAAAKRADVAALRAALDSGASTTWADAHNACTPLHWAAHEGSSDCVRLLLAAGADVAARALDGCTPLHSAAAQGHAACCRLLMEGGAAVDAADADGDTPLRLAMTRGHADCANLLLSRGATPDTDVALPTVTPRTANLASASSSARLQRGVRMSWLREWTEQHSAWKLPTWRVVQDIIVPATAATEECYCALSAAAPGPASVFVSHAWGAPWGSLVSALAGTVPPEAFVWVDVFAITQHKGDRQRADLLALKEVVEGSAVLLVVVCLSDEAARLLGGDGAPTMAQLVDRGCATMLPQLRIWCVFEIFTAIETPRPIVMQLGSLDIACREFFPNRNSNVVVNLMNTVDVRLAQATVPADRADILQQVEAHAGADAVNAKVSGALLGAFSCADWPEVTHAACGNAAPLAAVAARSAAALNERRGPKEQTAAHAAAGAGFTSVLQALLSDGADPAAPNVMQRTPLHRAAEGGHLGCIAVLLADRRVLIDARDERGSTALYMAAAGGQLAALRALEAAGADLHARTSKGASALHTACVNAQLPMVRYLLSRGFDPSAPDDEHNTPVMRACFAGCVPVLEELVAAGASLDGVDADGMTAVMCAADSGHTHALRWLHTMGASFEGLTTTAWERGAGRSSAAVAAEAGHADALRFLLSVMSDDARTAELRSLQDMELPQGKEGEAVRLLLREQQL